MVRHWGFILLGLGISLFVSACGTIATPAWVPPTQTAAAIALANQTATRTATPTQTASATPTHTPTVTPIPPSNTPIPATDTETPTPTVVTATSTELPSAEEILVRLANPANGETLFNTFQPAASFACSTCHRADSEDRLIGPGLLNIGIRAETRVEGQSAIEYLYASIVEPGAYVVDTFPDGLMPQNWAEIYSESEIYDIIAYLTTLR